MAHACDPRCEEELRLAGLGDDKALARLLSLLRASPETHLGMGRVQRLVAEARLAVTPEELARQLERLVERGLLGRLPSTSPEPVFDTVAEPHSHMIDEGTGQVVDLRVSHETLLAMIRQELAERPEAVEVLVRVRRDRVPAGAASPFRRRAPRGDGPRSTH